MLARRAFVAGLVAAATLPAVARTKAQLPPKVGAIRWPGPGYELHGFMAVPARARGPQPAILVIPDRSGADRFALGLTDALAQAGFVTCLPSALASLDEGVATVGWLATNRYATGKVGAVGLGWGADLVRQVGDVSDSKVTAAVLFGAAPLSQAQTPTLSLASVAELAGSGTDIYEQAWRQAIGFLKEHLA